MPCEAYKDALIQTAASGCAPQDELRAHLDVCASCRSTYGEEQALFAAIDSGLQKTANTEVPVSLLPRVRARLDEAATPKPIWTTNWLVLAAASTAIVALFAAQAVWHIRVGQTREETVAITSRSQVVPQPQRPNSFAVAPSRKDAILGFRAAIAKNLVPREALRIRYTTPEVLVPRDQETLLLRYTEQWRQRKRAPLVAEYSEETILAPLEVTPIQIAQLDVKLLTDEKSQ